MIFNNISSVAKYESKLLSRSWFFKIYIFFAVALVAFGYALMNDMSISLANSPTLVPYVFILVLNIMQSAVIVFMSADYLKRDKQLDTSEVFYVRPLSNAEYLFGKVLGTIRPFLVTDVVLALGLYVMIKYGFSMDANVWDYLMYIAIIILPSLVFFIGVSTALMLVVGNQAITYIIVLAFSGLSIAYIGDYWGHIFDIFLLNMPLAKSDVVGISNISGVVSHQIAYVMTGFSAMLLSVFMFKRLANSHTTERIFLALSLLSFAATGVWIGGYVVESQSGDRVAAQVMEVNGRYAEYPILEVADYKIDVEQKPHAIAARVRMDGVVSKSGQELVFNLNGGMAVKSVCDTLGDPLAFERVEHLIVVDLGAEVAEADSLAIVFDYEGTIDEREMFVDIDDKATAFDNRVLEWLNYDRRVAYVEPEWVVLTPESRWYVRPGVTYTTESTTWRRELFSQYSLTVKPLAGMTPVSQGNPVLMADSVTYSFTPEEPLRAMTLMISDYDWFHTNIGGLDYSLYLHKSNYKHVEFLEDVADQIPEVINDVMGDYERNSNTYYHLPRITLVDAPEHLYTYKRDWSSSQELGQPELMLIPAAGGYPASNIGLTSYNISVWYKYAKRYYSSSNRRQQESESDMKLNYLRGLTSKWNTGDSYSYSYSQAKGLTAKVSSNPHYLTSILFNSKYNVISDSLSWGNQLMEMYYLSYERMMSSINNSRMMLGMTSLEYSLMMLQDGGVNSYMDDRKYSSYITPLMVAGGNILFGEAQSIMGYDTFMSQLQQIVESNEYQNIEIGTLLDSVSLYSGCDVRSNLALLDSPLELPYYQMGGLKTELGYVDEEECYATEFVIKNESDYKGYVEVAYSVSGEVERLVVELLPHEIKRVVKHTTSVANVTINTMNSANIPQNISLGSANVSQSRMMGGGGMIMMSPAGGRGGGGGRGPMGGGPGGQQAEAIAEVSTLTPEGAYVIDRYDFATPGEIVVDNEDVELFSMSDPPTSGYLNLLVDKGSDNNMKYKAVNSWRAPYKWTLTSGPKYYGGHLLSAWVIKSGDGTQYAEWKIPVTKGKRYGLYFATSVPDQVRMLRNPRMRGNSHYSNMDMSYDFKLNLGGEELQSVKFDLKNMTSNTSTYGWEWLGDYNALQDTIVIRLTNKSEINPIVADAVKAVEVRNFEDKRRNK